MVAVDVGLRQGKAPIVVRTALREVPVLRVS